MNWDERAVLGDHAGTQDIIAKELAMRVVLTHVKDGMRILDAGCGNGQTAARVLQHAKVTYTGIDTSLEMVRVANERGLSATFSVGNVLDPPDGPFDLIITERVLINLTKGDQRTAVHRLCGTLARGGVYLGIENWSLELECINQLRSVMGLAVITPPKHNLYLGPEILKMMVPNVDMAGFIPFSGVYYFLSRVVNAALAKQEGREPDYNSPINQLALQIPAALAPGLLSFSQGAAMVWRKR